MYTALFWAFLDKVRGGLAPKAPGGAAAHVLVCEDWHFCRSTSAGSERNKFLAPGVDGDGVGKAEVPFQLIVGISVADDSLATSNLKVIMKIELNCLSSRTKPDMEINHAPSPKSLWRVERT